MLHLLAQSGQQSFNWGNLIQIAFVVILVLSSALGGALKKYAERKKQREIENKRLRQQEELMRTGRIEAPEKLPAQPPAMSNPVMQPVTADDAKRRLQELAERRRRELAEMARQQGARTSSPPTAPTMAPPPPIPPRNRAPQQRQPQQRQPSLEQQQRSKRDAAAREKAARDAAIRKKAQEQAARREREAEALDRAEREADRRESAEVPHLAHDYAATPAPAAPSQAVSAALTRLGAPSRAGPSTAADWRKAIVMAELLNRPIAMREPDEKVI